MSFTSTFASRPPRLCGLFSLVASFTLGFILFLPPSAFAQETTGGIQGTVKDPSGAVVPNATVVATGTTLIGSKQSVTDSAGAYRFDNLPPGIYTVTVTAKGFKTIKRGGLEIEVGHLPTVDFSLEVGAASTTVEVSTAPPLIDTTTSRTMTNVTEDIINNIPHGNSFQSMIQFAPMARNEPLAGGQMVMPASGAGGGGALPGSSANGSAVGYMIGGAADSESSYLIEGQDTENVSGGASYANVPFQFIQEVQIKTTGIGAQYGGALGGVTDVLLKHGSNNFHGSGFFTFESDTLDGASTFVDHNFLRYDPVSAPIDASGGTQFLDQAAQTYIPKPDTFHFLTPGFTLGGPIKSDRIWFYLGFAPFKSSISRTVNFNPSICGTKVNGITVQCNNTVLGTQTYHQNSWQYYSYARLSAALTQKIRLHGGWLYQYERETGSTLPNGDPIPAESATFINSSINENPAQFAPSHGWSQPNSLYTFGADVTLSPTIVATSHFGYIFTNYHDFGWPTTGANLSWQVGSLDKNDNSKSSPKRLPSALQNTGGASTTPYDNSFTLFNVSKHYQFNQDIAFLKSGWWGTHNFRFGYQLNRESNIIDQNGNVPLVNLYPGAGQYYSPSTTIGGNNCGPLTPEWGGCAGQYGYVTITDFATILPKEAVDWNHAFYAQDAWNVGRGLTFTVGLRVEKEDLPVPPGLQQPGVTPPASIHFSWGDKIAPRLGAAWGSPNGKMKIFASYGVVNDVMKLLLAQTSWGAQVFENCTYPLGPDSSGTFTQSDISVVFVNSRACPNGGPTTPANFSGGTTPASLTDAGSGVSLIENVNLRPWEPIAPGVKPYREHEYTAGFDYQLGSTWALEARYDRRRLDHVIEDASLADPFNFEMYTVVNPGQGVNSTIDGYANFLGSLGASFGIPNFVFHSSAFGTCPSCPPLPQAVRNYDAVELRLTKAPSHAWGGNWAGMFSYTWSSLWGNYTGLTTTDQIDGGATGRDSPDTTRAFDEPFYYFTDTGASGNGPLPTDRPNTFKGYVYYALPWKGMNTTFGIFQTAYQGTPLSSFADLGLACCNEPIEATYLFGRGKWANVTQDPTTGTVTLGTPYDRRTPWYTQTDFHISHSIKINKNHENQKLEFSADVINLLNQHAAVNYWQGFNSIAASSSLFPGAIFQGAASYQQLESAYNPQTQLNSQTAGQSGGFIVDSQYGQPNLWQLSRNIRLGITFTF